jgi:hypothetical protein
MMVLASSEPLNEMTMDSLVSSACATSDRAVADREETWPVGGGECRTDRWFFLGVCHLSGSCV